MKKVKASKVLVDLDDKPIVADPTDQTHLTVGIGIGVIMQGFRGDERGGALTDPLKALELARKFYKAKGDVEVDASDMKLIEQGVKGDKRFGPLVLGQLLEALADAKEIKEKE